jgi:hypothetical protein
MPQTRKLVRTAMRTALADADEGFNARLAEVAPTYGIDPFLIDWTLPSDSFIQSHVDRAGREVSKLVTGVTVAIYTSLSAQSREEVSKMGGGFVMQITAHLDFEVNFKGADGEGVEATEDVTEEIADAIEDAVLLVLCDRNTSTGAALWEHPYFFKGDFACARGPIVQEEDGYSQRLPFTFIYEVNA